MIGRLPSIAGGSSSMQLCSRVPSFDQRDLLLVMFTTVTVFGPHFMAFHFPLDAMMALLLVNLTRKLSQSHPGHKDLSDLFIVVWPRFPSCYVHGKMVKMGLRHFNEKCHSSGQFDSNQYMLVCLEICSLRLSRRRGQSSHSRTTATGYG